MKCSLGISNFLEKISSLPILLFSSIALITSEGFLISPCYSLELCIQMGMSFLFSFASSFCFSELFVKSSSDNHFALLHFFHKGGVICMSEVMDISPGDLDSSL